MLDNWRNIYNPPMPHSIGADDVERFHDTPTLFLLNHGAGVASSEVLGLRAAEALE